MDNLIQIITVTAGIGAFIASMCYTIYKYYKKDKSDDYFSPMKTFETDLKIQDILSELRTKINADRVYVCKFHNGDYYFDGSAIKKVSRTHESCQNGISHESILFQAIGISLIPDVIKVIYETQKIEKPIIKNLSEFESGFYKNHLSNSAAKVVIKYRLEINKRIIGYLGVQYNHIENKINISDSDLENVKKYAELVESTISPLVLKIKQN